MRKKVVSFIMLFAMTLGFVGGCNDEQNEDSILVAEGKEVIAKINGVYYTADDVYGSLITSNSNASFLYEQLERKLIETVIQISDGAKSRIENEILAWKKNIETNSALKGTKYEDDLKTALEDEFGVSSEEELLEKKIFELKESTLLNQYKEEMNDTYYNSYLATRNIYHVSQILISVNENREYDYFNIEINKDQAKKLYDVVSQLQKGESFYNVALQYSDDSSSKNNGGD